ncbi:MAG: homoserine dehydrogenase [Candidatus Bathyarchaeia archaeon]
MYNLAFIGFGNVGQGLARTLVDKKALLKAEHGFEFKTVAVSDIRMGSILDEDGVDLERLLQLAKQTGMIKSYRDGQRDISGMEIVEKKVADIIIEVTWTNLETGEPGLTHIRKALAAGMHVVTTNKGPIALAYRELEQLAKDHDVFLRFEGTVLTGTPTINLVSEGLAGAHVKSIRGILNGTTNYVLTQMETGMSYEKALEKAQKLGYAEADPTMDVDAWDPAAKITILSNVAMNADMKVGDVERTGIRGVTVEEIKSAQKQGKRLKLIAKAWRQGDNVCAKVAPESVPSTNALARVEGVLNAVTFETDVLKDVTVIGPGAGGPEAGYALLNDMLAINRYLSRAKYSGKDEK